MKYKVGDRVRIKSLDWYNKNKDEFGNIDINEDFIFYADRSKYCGKVFTISEVFDNCYSVKEDNHEYYWADEMIEGLVEEENKPKFKVGDEVRIKGTDIGGTIESIIRGQLIVETKGSKIPVWPEEVVLIEGLVEEDVDLIPKFGEFSDNEPLDIPTMTTDFIKEHGFPCPNGYIFKDENGNIINATKIILEKKKKEYPKTYEECCEIFQYNKNLKVYPPFNADIPNYDALHLFDLLEALRKLLICRDAYWKIAGEEMGLKKPWEPNWTSFEGYPAINMYRYQITLSVAKDEHHFLVFPTEEMRDAFYEAFKNEIENCKELL